MADNAAGWFVFVVRLVNDALRITCPALSEYLHNFPKVRPAFSNIVGRLTTYGDTKDSIMTIRAIKHAAINCYWCSPSHSQRRHVTTTRESTCSYRCHMASFESPRDNNIRTVCIIMTTHITGRLIIIGGILYALRITYGTVSLVKFLLNITEVLPYRCCLVRSLRTLWNVECSIIIV